MKKLIITAIAAACTLLGGCATQIQHVETKKALAIPDGVDSKPVQLKKIVAIFKRGQELGATRIGIVCLPGLPMTWKGGRLNITDDEITEVFQDVLKQNNYQVVGDTNALFDDPSTWAAEILVAGQISHAEFDICYPMSSQGNYDTHLGGATIKVDWQIYSRPDRKVINKFSTTGTFSSPKISQGGVVTTFHKAFENATTNLLADENFKKLVLDDSDGRIVLTPTGEVVNISSKSVNSLSNVTDSTFTVFAGSGFGSGFVISDNGYMITNQHVVKTAKRVTVTNKNGDEFVADVIKTHDARDIALLKIRNYTGTSINIFQSENTVVGDEVYAIGTPRREELSQTVSKGIVSATIAVKQYSSLSNMTSVVGLNQFTLSVQGNIAQQNMTLNGCVIEDNSKTILIKATRRAELP